MQSYKMYYLGRKGYAATNGQEYVFARKDSIKKGAAFFCGTYDREAHKAVMAEIKLLGLETVTVLVNGLVTYSGAGINTIRVDSGYEETFIVKDIDNDFMADTRLAKKLCRSSSRQGR